MHRRIFLLLSFCLIGLVATVGSGYAIQASSSLSLGLPIACSLGQDCFILQYPDRDPTPSAVDFGCGRMTYDGHQGTDFAISDRQVMAEGITVKAVAAGTVLRVRDGVADQPSGALERSLAAEGFECGNGVVIDHGQGWETQYCHLRQGSVAVNPGDTVSQGTNLGLVGMSGQASFPHVHLSVRRQGQTVDPFVGPDAGPGCQVNPQPLWRQPLPYVPTGLIRSGFAQRPPELEELWAGSFYANTLPATSPALVFWVQAYGVLQGDIEHIQLIDPTGQIVVDEQHPLQSPQRVWSSFVGQRAASQPLASGRWRGRYRLTRGQQTLIDQQHQILVE